MNGPRLRSGDWAELGASAGAVRTEVFVREQGIPAELEWDEWDARSLHCVAYDGDRPVATGRLLPDGHIGRMAVLAQYRRQGVGGRILDELIEAARARGDSRIELSAQSYVVDFYAHRGFVAIGEPYDEVGIEHRKMAMSLAPAVDPVAVEERMQTMADASTLRVRDWSPARGAGGGVYLLHGLGEHVGRHDALARWFCARGWRVRAHDHLGHGLSSGARGVIGRTGQLVEHAARLVDAFGDELGSPPLLLGHSMGGALAAELALGTQTKIAALILSSPALATRRKAGQRLLLSLLNRLAPGLALSNGLDPEQLSHDPAVARAYVEDPLVHRRICPRLARWIIDTGGRARRDAHRLAVPTLLLVAGADALVDPVGSRAFADRAPPGMLTLHWYASLRHEIFNESEPDRSRVLADMDRWLRTIAQERPAAVQAG
jgi:alpha-beta hydrolase superfamily lysophospholipase/predicted GNAT family N-acyltransferase